MQRSSPLKRYKSLRPRSHHPAARQREDELAEAKEQAREELGWMCIVPGCRRTTTEMHHAYPRGSHPDAPHRQGAWNLFPVCYGLGRDTHHHLAQNPSLWLYWALRECADVRRAASQGRRPAPSRAELHGIIRRHAEQAQRPHVSPIGAVD